MKRRQLLKLAPVVLAAGAVPVAAVAAEETPVMKLFREWEAAMADMDARKETISDADWVALDCHIDGLEEKIMDEPAQNGRDFIAKIVSWSHGGVFPLPKDPSDAFWAEARALVVGAA